MNKNTILVMMQGLYGNKVLTEISENNIVNANAHDKILVSICLFKSNTSF